MSLPNGVAAEQIDLVERFVSAYNELDSHFQEVLGDGASRSFRSSVDFYARRHRWWRDAELLRVCAGLRNILVHDKMSPYEYPCVPTQQLVRDLEAARDRLLHPRRAIPFFKRDVVTVQPSDSLAHVLKLVNGLKYSHFPVYEYADAASAPIFKGVLTENGITRWLAEYVALESTLVELNEQPVSEVLSREEDRTNFEFAPREETVEEIRHRFHENTYLEAVLFTAHGRPQEKLLGIGTRWDILNSD
jgi:CBS domain-containing protein